MKRTEQNYLLNRAFYELKYNQKKYPHLSSELLDEKHNSAANMLKFALIEAGYKDADFQRLEEQYPDTLTLVQNWIDDYLTSLKKYQDGNR